MKHYHADVRFYTEESFFIVLNFSFECESTDDVFERLKEEVSSICNVKPVDYVEVSFNSCSIEVPF